MKYNDKSIAPVFTFIIWLALFAFICIIGISNVFAATYSGFDYRAQLYDNLGPNLTSVTTSGPTAGTGSYEGYIGYTANSSGGAWGISSPITLIANHTYTLTASIPNECGNIILSTYNRIGVGTSLSSAVTSYQNNTNVNEVYSKAIGGNNFLVQFAFTPTINGSYIVFPYATNKSCSSSRTFLEKITIDDLGSNGISETTINNSLNSQTNELNNSIQNSTDTIINNQNQNNEELKDVINENFNSCRDSFNLLNTSTPTIVKNQNGDDRNGYYVLIKETGSYYILLNTTNTMYWGKTDNINNASTLIGSTSSNYSTTYNFTAGEYFVIWGLKSDNDKLMVTLSSNGTSYEPYGEQICQNKIDDTNDKLDGIQGSITDSTPPDTSGLENSAGWLPPGPLDSILNLPLTMLNSLTNSLGKTCSPLTLTLPYVNKNIEIPCLSSIFAQITGVDSLWTWVGTIASVLILYNYLLNLYAWVDRVLTLRAEFDEAMGADLANWGRL